MERERHSGKERTRYMDGVLEKVRRGNKLRLRETNRERDLPAQPEIQHLPEKLAAELQE